MENYLIYSVEDDSAISEIINKTLTKQNYLVKSFENGESFLDAFAVKKPNMVLLDLMLPKIQGIDILRKIRSEDINNDIVVIILSAKSMVSDKIVGLDEGADDYIGKPFNLSELISRVNAHARRSSYTKQLTIGNVSLFPNEKIIKLNGKLVEITNNEFTVLHLLFENFETTISKDLISEVLYGKTHDDAKLKKQIRTIDMFITSLRQKLESEGKIRIETIYGKGIKLINE